MSILKMIKTFFINYLVPCINLIGTLLLFIILSNLLFSIRRFYLFLVLFFLTICLIASFIIYKNKLIKFVHILFFIFFSIMLGLITKLTISYNNPWALVYKIREINNAAQKLNYQETNFSNFPTKGKLFFTYLYFELKSLLNNTAPINTNILGFNITLDSYQTLALLFREIFIEKNYYIPLINSCPTIIDCGSNEGISILFFKKVYPNSKIIGFEAHPKNFEILRKNIEKNKLSNVKVFNNAVYNSEGKVAFSLDPSVTSAISNKNIKNIIYVNSVLLSNYIDGFIDLLKIDIEGAESAVIEELDQHNKLKFIKNIIMEFHPGADKKYNNFAKILNIFEKNGFCYQMKEVDPPLKNAIIYAYQN
ncbi:FkbM family methyltransferase [Candidatus Babeliales bacterium]|nr:FkbM family methyltransferase [Candidatus Babeliales bacterium]